MNVRLMEQLINPKPMVFQIRETEYKEGMTSVKLWQEVIRAWEMLTEDYDEYVEFSPYVNIRTGSRMSMDVMGLEAIIIVEVGVKNVMNIIGGFEEWR